MPLINKIVRSDGQILSTYRGESGYTVKTLKSDNPFVRSIKILKYDRQGQPQTLITKDGLTTDIYTKAEDASVLLKTKIGDEVKKIIRLPHIIFEEICAKLFK